MNSQPLNRILYIDVDEEREDPIDVCALKRPIGNRSRLPDGSICSEQEVLKILCGTIVGFIRIVEATEKCTPGQVMQRAVSLMGELYAQPGTNLYKGTTDPFGNPLLHKIQEGKQP